MFEYPNKLDIIFDKLALFEIKPIIVGGYVRDYILQIDSKDIDIELYGLDNLDTLEEILQEFGDVNSVGKSFGVCKLHFDELEIDFSLPRSDSKIAAGHRGFSVTTDKTLDFKSAASRRDFTINAIGYDVKNKKLLDPYNGTQDIKNKVLRAVDIQKFSEDPLRVLRGISFSARLEFKLDDVLLSLFKVLSKDNFLKELPKERIYEEFKKLFLKSKTPSIGLKLLQELKLLDYFSFNECYEQVDYFAKNKSNNSHIDMVIFFSLLYTKDTLQVIDLLTNKLTLITNIKLFLEEKENINIHDHSNYAIYKLATRVNIEYFLLFLNAYYTGSKNENIDTLKNKAKLLGVYNKQLSPMIHGKDLITLGLLPSKQFSSIILDVYEAQMREEINTVTEANQWLNTYLKEKKLL